MNNRNNTRLEELAREYNATVEHANDVLNEFVEAAIEQAMIEAFNELSPADQMALIVGLLCEQVEDNIVDELTAVVEAIEKAAQEEEMRRYEEECAREFFAELERVSGMYRIPMERVVTPEPKPTLLEVGLPEDVLKHLKRLGVKF